MTDRIEFALQGAPESADHWRRLARRAEQAGFDTLCVSDHPGLTWSPFVALGAAAAVTGTIKLATAVLNSGVRQPLDIASEVATLDRLSEGRAVLGLGAGHTPGEWTATGQAYPRPAQRVDRLLELLPAVARLLAGDTVTCRGTYLRLEEASLATAPDRRIPLMIGGNNRRLLRFAGEHADIVEISGLGRTLADGHHHQIRWSPADIDDLVSRIVLGAAETGGRPVLSALVQHVCITDDPEAAARRFLLDIGLAPALTAPRSPASTDAASRPQSARPEAPPAARLTVDELIAAPFVFIGSVAEVTAKIGRARDEWGISRYTVRAPALDAIASVLRELRGIARPVTRGGAARGGAASGGAAR
jgi:probable F420-dependent oxidoreductase